MCRGTVGQREKVDKIESGKQNDSAALASVGDASMAVRVATIPVLMQTVPKLLVKHGRMSMKMAFAADNDVS